MKLKEIWFRITSSMTLQNKTHAKEDLKQAKDKTQGKQMMEESCHGEPGKMT